MSPVAKRAGKSRPPGEAERVAVRELVKAARARGEHLAGPKGLLKTITATMAGAGPLTSAELASHTGRG